MKNSFVSSIWRIAKHWRLTRLSVMFGLLALLTPCLLPAQSTEKKKTMLATVRRVVVAPLFLGTETLPRPETEEKPADKPDNKKPTKPANPIPSEYLDQLRHLEAHARARLPERLATRTLFQPVSEDEWKAASKELHLSPFALFQNDGLIRGGKFPVPDVAVVRKLAEKLKADAVLLAVMDEPRRANGQYYFDGFGLNYESPHVRVKIGFTLLLADGTEVLHAYVESKHPLTQRRSRDYILVDWEETSDQVIESFLDELTRYAPDKSGQ